LTTHKENFRALADSDRRRIGSLVPILLIVNIAQFLLASHDLPWGSWGGAALNAVAVYWCLAPDRAPNFWFSLLPYIWMFTAVFDGIAVVQGVSGDGQRSDMMLALNGVSLLILPFLAGPLLRLYRLSRPATPTRPAGHDTGR